MCSRGTQVPKIDSEHVNAARQSLEARTHQILRLVVDALVRGAVQAPGGEDEEPNPDKVLQKKQRKLKKLMTHFQKSKGVKWFTWEGPSHYVTGMAFRALERLRMEPGLEGAANALQQSLVAFGAM